MIMTYFGCFLKSQTRAIIELFFKKCLLLWKIFQKLLQFKTNNLQTEQFKYWIAGLYSTLTLDGGCMGTIIEFQGSLALFNVDYQTV